MELGGVELDDLDNVEQSELELDDVLERPSSKITQKGVQVSGSIIGGSSGLEGYVNPGSAVELKQPSSPPSYGGIATATSDAVR